MHITNYGPNLSSPECDDSDLENIFSELWPFERPLPLEMFRHTPVCCNTGIQTSPVDSSGDYLTDFQDDNDDIQQRNLSRKTLQCPACGFSGDTKKFFCHQGNLPILGDNSLKCNGLKEPKKTTIIGGEPHYVAQLSCILSSPESHPATAEQNVSFPVHFSSPSMPLDTVEDGLGNGTGDLTAHKSHTANGPSGQPSSDFEAQSSEYPLTGERSGHGLSVLRTDSHVMNTRLSLSVSTTSTQTEQVADDVVPRVRLTSQQSSNGEPHSGSVSGQSNKCSIVRKSLSSPLVLPTSRMSLLPNNSTEVSTTRGPVDGLKITRPGTLSLAPNAITHDTTEILSASRTPSAVVVPLKSPLTSSQSASVPALDAKLTAVQTISIPPVCSRTNTGDRWAKRISSSSKNHASENSPELASPSQKPSEIVDGSCSLRAPALLSPPISFSPDSTAPPAPPAPPPPPFSPQRSSPNAPPPPPPPPPLPFSPSSGPPSSLISTTSGPPVPPPPPLFFSPNSGPPAPPPPPPPPGGLGSNSASPEAGPPRPPPPPGLPPTLLPARPPPVRGSTSSSGTSPVLPDLTQTPASWPIPPAGGVAVLRTCRKPAVRPKEEMTPLYWTKINLPPSVLPLTPDSPGFTALALKTSFWENVPDIEVDEDKLVGLFAKKKAAPVKLKTKKSTEEVALVAKKVPAQTTLDKNRAKEVGIIMKTLKLEGKRLTVEEITNALYEGSTHVLICEIVDQLDQLKVSDEEIQPIKQMVEKDPGVHLDSTDRLLYDLSKISCFQSRISCLKTYFSFDERLTTLMLPAVALRDVLTQLTESDAVRRILGLVLAHGNYMNGGNRMRDQADGFGIDMLTKIKDVKGRNPEVTLLHLILEAYIEKYEKETFPNCSFPLPAVSLLRQAIVADADSSIKSLEEMRKTLKEMENHVMIISKKQNDEIAGISETGLTDKMTAFLVQAKTKVDDTIALVKESQDKFRDTIQSFQWSTKGKTEVDDIKDFLGIWIQFATDVAGVLDSLALLKKKQMQAEERRLRTLQEKQKKSVNVTAPASVTKQRMNNIRRQETLKRTA